VDLGNLLICFSIRYPLLKEGVATFSTNALIIIAHCSKCLTLRIKTHVICIKSHYAKCHCVKCPIFLLLLKKFREFQQKVITLSVIMLGVFMLSVVMLSVDMLSVIML
jgi:hypothetical protein